MSVCRVLGTKFNLIGMVTGVSHEKLQVYHRWTAWIMCAFAISFRSFVEKSVLTG